MFFQDYDDIRNKIILNLKEYTDTYKLDTSELSYVSQLVNALAVSDDNILFYISLLMNEGSIYDAILPETIIRTAKELGVNIHNVIPGDCYGRMNISILDDSKDGYYVIDKNLEFAPINSDAPYVPLYEHQIKYDSVSKKAYVTKEINNIKYPVYSAIEVSNKGKFITYDMNLIQYTVKESTFVIENDIKEFNIDKLNRGFYYKIEVNVNGVEYTQVENIYVLTDNSYTIDYYDNSTIITFGTSIDDYKVLANSSLVIKMYISLGASGNIVSNTLTPKGQLLERNRSMLTNMVLEHSDVINGADPMDILQIKKLIHTKYLTRDTIISGKYDVDNINVYLDNIAKYTKGIRIPSLTSEFLVFFELTMNNKIIETNTIKVNNVDVNLVKQNTVYDAVSINDDVEFSNSSEYNDKNTLVSNYAAVCPFEMKYNANFKEFRYFSLKSGVVVKMNTSYGIISPYDSLTSTNFESLQALYNPELNTMNFALTFIASTPDLTKLSDVTVFSITVKLIDQDSNDVIYEANNGTLSSINTGRIETDNTGNYMFTFNISKNLLSPSVNYVIDTKVMFMGEVISLNASDIIMFYEKLPISSKVKEGLPVDLFSTTELYDNVFTATFNQRIKTAFKFDSNGAGTKIQIVGNRLPEVGTELGIMDYASFDSGKLYIAEVTDPLVTPALITYYDNSSLTSSSKFNFTINFTIPTLNKSAVYAMKLELYYSGNTIVFNYPAIDFNNIEHSSYKTVYQVPVLSKKSYNDLIKYNNEILPFSMIQKMYTKLDEKILYGMQYNIKFLKTFGYINGMKYNQSYSNALPNTPIPMPISIVADIMPSPTFNADVHSVEIKNAIIEYINNNTGVEKNLYLSKISGAVFEAVDDAIYDFKITNIDNNIIYDFTTNDITKFANEYVPELIVINPEQIKLNIK